MLSTVFCYYPFLSKITISWGIGKVFPFLGKLLPLLRKVFHSPYQATASVPAGLRRHFPLSGLLSWK